MALCMQRAVGVQCAAVAHKRPVRGLAPLVRCSAAPEHKDSEAKLVAKLAMPMAAAVTASVVLSAVQLAAPGEALAARSGGRAGASSFAARRAAPRAAPSRMQSYSSTTIVTAPPVYGYSPFGFGGFGMPFMPVFPVPFFGGFLQLMFLMLIVSAVFNVVKGALGSGSNKNKSQDWDDL